MEIEKFYSTLDKSKFKIFHQPNGFWLHPIERTLLSTLTPNCNLPLSNLIHIVLTKLKMSVVEYSKMNDTFVVVREINVDSQPVIAAISSGEMIDLSFLSNGKINTLKYYDDDILSGTFTLLSQIDVLEVLTADKNVERKLRCMEVRVIFVDGKGSSSVEILKKQLNTDSIEIVQYQRPDCMLIDNSVFNGLNIDELIKDFDVKTVQGVRLLGTFFRMPLLNISEIEKRQKYAIKLRGADLSILKTFPDLRRIISSLESSRCTLENLFRLKQIITKIPELTDILNHVDDADNVLSEAFVMPLYDLQSKLEPLLHELERIITPDCKICIKLNPDLSALHAQKKELSKEIDEEYQRVLTINKKIKQNGTSFKISRSEYKFFEAEFEQSKFLLLQFLKSGVSFTTKRLSDLLSVDIDERIAKLENEIRTELIGFAKEFIPLIDALNYVVAFIDVVQSFSGKFGEGWTVPKIGSFVLKDGWNPLVKKDVIKNDLLLLNCKKVKNTIHGTKMQPGMDQHSSGHYNKSNTNHANKMQPGMDQHGSGHCNKSNTNHATKMQSGMDQHIQSNIAENPSFVVITGPNMGGKSTFLKSVGIISILFQIGSPVPAALYQGPLFSTIRVRIGANDCPSSHLSTFMTEMVDMARIVTAKNGLILIDELGRGTSAIDGLSIALAIKESLTREGGFNVSLFATHFPQIAGEETLNLCVGIENDLITFRMEEGVAGESYGIEVARKVGFPEEVVKNAIEYLN